MKHNAFLRRRAFTLVEVTIAVVVISIMASLVVINLSQSRRTARDGIRKADVAAVLQAVTNYSLANASSFIRYPLNGKPDVCSITTVNGSGSVTDGTGAGCVGAAGRAYGKINLKSAQTTGYISGSPVTRNYPSKSIVDALKDGGYIESIPRDPLSKNASATDASAVDYALIRACPTGQQHVNTRGQLFAVWTILENQRSDLDIENVRLLPGSPTAFVDPGNPTALYQYDFAAASDQTRYETNGFAVGNAPAKAFNGGDPLAFVEAAKSCGS